MTILHLAILFPGSQVGNDDTIKEGEMGRTCRMHKRDKCIKHFSQKTEVKTWGDQGMGDSMILHLILRN